MRLRPILRLLLAGLLAGSALLAPWPGEGPDTAPLRMRYQVAHADGPGDWPMFRHDPAHTGYNPTETQLKPPLRLKWSYDIGTLVSSPAVANGVVYAGTGDFGSARKLYALEAATGALRWSYATGGLVRSSPAVADGLVYVGSQNAKIFALEVATGALRWSYNTGMAIVFSPPAVANGLVYVGGRSRPTLRALDATSGAARWEYYQEPPTVSMVDSSPAVANGLVYVGSSDGKVYAHEAATGALRWSYTTGAGVDSSPMVANGVVYVGSGDGKVYALEAASGALRWSYTTGPNVGWLYSTEAGVGSSPAVANGVVYVGGGDGKVYALEAASGALRWSYTTGAGVGSSPAVANGVVYVGSGDGKVYGLEAATGALLWSYTTGARVTSSPAVANGVVYVGSQDGKLYAFETQPPSVLISVAAYQTASVSFPISWTVPITWTGVAAASYDVQYRDGVSAAWTDLITSTAALSTTFSGQDGHTYYFQARSRTAMGSLGDWSDPVSTTVDLTAPTGSISVAGGATYATNPVTLTLSASDATSGVSHMALSDDGTTWENWQDYAASKSRTLPGSDGPKAVYVWYKDAAGNVSPVYSDTIVLDTAAPTGTVSINGGASDTNSTAVTLTQTAGDALSGVTQMSFSNDGVSYSPWEDYATTRSWSVPGGNGTKTVYARFRDNAGNVSSPVSDTILLNTTAPSSAVSPLALYQSTAAFTVTWQGTVGGSGPPTYDVQYRDGAAGTWTDWITNTLSTSAVFTGTEGHTYYFQSRARDLAGNVEPYVGGDGHTRTTVDLTPPSGALTINSGALDSTAVAVTLGLAASDSLSGVAQASYSDDGSSWSGWESYAATRSWTLPSGDGEKAVWARFRDVAGNISTPVSDTIRLDTSVAPAYGFSVNEGALFTSQVTVTLDLPANPGTAQMMVSNDGGFYGAAWEPYSAYRAWAITQYGSYVIPRTTYVKYKDVSGNVSGVYQDDIILDLTAPTGSVSIQGAGAAGIQGQGARVQGLMPHASAWGGDATPLPHSPLSVNGEGVGGEVASAAATSVTLKLSASDVESGVGGMMVSNSPAFSGASWEPFSASKSWSLESGGKVYVAFKDNAGNASPIYAAALSGAKESLPALALGTVHPKTGGAVASSEAGATVSFPPGAVSAKTDITLVPAVESSQQQGAGALRSTGKFLTLTAKAGATPITTVSQPYTITVSYAAGDVAGIDESTLGLYWWNGSAWQKEPGSAVNTVARTVSAALDHLSAFAVLGESSTRKLYLPLVIRSYAGGW